MYVKSTLESWSICLGIAPLPPDVYKKVINGKPCRPRVAASRRSVRLTKEQTKSVLEVVVRMLKNGDQSQTIYKKIVADRLMCCEKTGKESSSSKISDFIYDVRIEMSLSGDKLDCFKVAYEMKQAGKSNEEIGLELGFKDVSIKSLVSRYKRRLQLKQLGVL